MSDQPTKWCPHGIRANCLHCELADAKSEITRLQTALREAQQERDRALEGEQAWHEQWEFKQKAWQDAEAECTTLQQLREALTQAEQERDKARQELKVEQLVSNRLRVSWNEDVAREQKRAEQAEAALAAMTLERDAWKKGLEICATDHYSCKREAEEGQG